MPPETVTLISAQARIDVAVADTPMSWDISEAPGMTLTVVDPGRRLSDYSPGLLGDERTDLIAHVYDRPWRVTEINHDRAAVTLTLEHPGSWGMRNLQGPLAAPDGISRPGMASLLWARSRAGRKTDPLFTPLINREATGYKPPVLKAETLKGDRDAQRVRDKHLTPGFKPGVSFKIKGETADDEQKRVLAAALSVCDEEKWPRLAKLALLCALIIESLCRNLKDGDASSSGVLQLLAETARGLGIDPRDIEDVVRAFGKVGFWGKGGAVNLARKHPRWLAGFIAQQVQGSAHPERYQTVLPEARAILDAWSGGDGGDLTAAQEDTSSPFDLAAGENAWEKFKALGTDSQRRAYATLENLVFATDNQLQESRPLLVLERGAPGVKTIGTWKTDANLQVDTIPFELFCDDDIAWRLAGHTITVQGEGDANGLWIITKWARASRKDRHASFEAERLRPFLPESKIAQATASAAGTSAASAPATRQTQTDRRVTQVKRIVDLIDGDKKAYLWGGIARSTGFDCSGFCSYVGNELGIVSGRLTTGPFESWGEAGEGEILTFWVMDNGIPDQSHMYGSLKIGGKLRKFEAGGGTDGGPTGWRPSTSPIKRPGFKPRHAKGW